MRMEFQRAAVTGWIHQPSVAIAALVLTHGAGSDCNAPFLIAAAEALCDAGFAVLRYDLPFRQKGAATLNAAQQARDREGIVHAAEEMHKLFPNVPLVLGGHSYGGRQSSMVAAEQPGIAQALMLLSYPLHPPRQPEKLRTEHLPSIQMPSLFVHGTRDPFGSIEELRSAAALIPAAVRIEAIEKGGHNLPDSAAALLPGWLSAIMKR
jgi:uncharacterized protein